MPLLGDTVRTEIRGECVSHKESHILTVPRRVRGYRS